MSRLILVCGETGAGKTTYSIELSSHIKAVRLSIDPWMQTLFSKDMQSLDFSWITERVERCQEQIWDVSVQILQTGGNVVLDLGFTTQAQRTAFLQKASGVGVAAEVHYLDAPEELRRTRVQRRNRTKDPRVYSFEVTKQMFDFMEPRFERPTAKELRHGKRIESIERAV